jgi:hypothetical protein
MLSMNALKAIVAERALLPRFESCTSRHISTIEREFEKAAQVEIRVGDNDVKRYLKGRIESEGRLVRLVKADPALQLTIENTQL